MILGQYLALNNVELIEAYYPCVCFSWSALFVTFKPKLCTINVTQIVLFSNAGNYSVSYKERIDTLHKRDTSSDSL